MFVDCSCERLCFLEAMDSFLEKWGATSFQNAMGGDLSTSTLTTSKSSSSSSKMAAPEAKVKKEKKDKKGKKKDKQDEKKAAKSEACEVKKEDDGWPSGLQRPPPPPNLKAEPVATTESSEIRPGFTPRKAGSTRDLSMHFFGYKRRGRGRN